MERRVSAPKELVSCAELLLQGQEREAWEALRSLPPKALNAADHALAAALGAHRLADAALVDVFTRRACELSIGHSRILATVLLNVAQIAASSGRYRDAGVFLGKLLEILRRAPIEDASHLRQRASELALTMGDDDLALRALDEKGLAGQANASGSASGRLLA